MVGWFELVELTKWSDGLDGIDVLNGGKFDF